MAYTKLPSELSALVGDEVEGPVEVLVRKMRRVVLRRVKWMWIVVCGFAGRGMESWRGWMVVGMSLFGVLVAMFGCFGVDGGGGPSARRKGADGLKFYRVELGFGRTLVSFGLLALLSSSHKVLLTIPPKRKNTSFSSN